MTNEEKAREISWIHHKEYWYEGCDGGEYYNDSVGECEESALEMAEWKDRQFEWHECMHDMAMKDNLTNKEFREMLEKMPDDALICVECCNPKAMVYDEKYNLIRID